jgi:RNA polymerase-binding transcription factor DksA
VKPEIEKMTIEFVFSQELCLSLKCMDEIKTNNVGKNTKHFIFAPFKNPTMAGIRNLVSFAAKFLNMAKSKVKAKKAPVKGKSAKPVAKSKSKPVAKKNSKPAKKAAPKAKKPIKPVKKAKPVAKKAVAKKPVAKAKPVKKAAKAKPVVKKAVAKKPLKKVVVKKKPVAAKKAETKKKAVAPPKTKKPEKPVAKAEAPKVKAKLGRKPKIKTVEKKVKRDMPEFKKQLYITSAKPQPQKSTTIKKAAYKDINMRYSDEELKEFKDLIDKKLVTAREELKYLKEALENHNDNQSGSKAWNMEEGSDTSEMETLMNQIARQHQYIRNLELALVRIENKTYGICRLTGKLIPKERLRIVPHATLSLEAKMSRKAEDVTPAEAAAVTPPTDFAEGFED